MKRRAPGTGTIARRGDRFMARLPDEVRMSLGVFHTYDEAERILDAAVLVEEKSAAPKKTLGVYGRTVIDRRELDGYRTTADERRRWRCYVEPWECASWPLAEVKRRHIADWLRGLHIKKLADSTQSNALNLLRAVFRAAVDDEIIETNPCADVRVKKRGRVHETSTFLSIEELGCLLAVADDEARHLIAFAAGAGLRQGEMRSLRVSDVHLDADEPNVIVRYGSPKESTKNGKIRRVPLFGLALEAAKSWSARQAAMPRRSVRLPATATFFFATSSGCVRQKGHIVDRDGERWRGWLREAGIRRNVRWHDLRHTCATLLLTGKLTDQAWSLEAVKEMLGHSSITVTERYAKATGSLAEHAARRHREGTKAPSESDSAREIAAEFLRSRLRDLNSRPTVYEKADIAKTYAHLERARAFVVTLLERASTVGGVSRHAVELAGAALDEIDTARLSSVA